MKTVTRRPARKRSQTHKGKRRRRQISYAAVAWKMLSLPSLGAQRNAALFSFAVLLLGLIALLALPGFNIRYIDVKGNQGTANQDVEDAASLALGNNAFLLNTASVAAAVAQLPGVEQAQARVVLPDKVEITIKDVRPEVAWISNNLVYWLDKNGLVRDIPQTEPERRITIKDLTNRAYNKGDKVDISILRGAQQLSVLMQRDIQSFEYQRDGEIIVVGVQNWRAVFNTQGSLNEQVDALRLILSSGRTVAYVDVRVPSMASYR